MAAVVASHSNSSSPVAHSCYTIVCSESESLLATAATNGAVVIWNLQREGFKHVQGTKRS